MPSPIAAVDLIQSAMRLVGILESGETATADEINDGLAVLNDVIEQWKTGTLSIWQTANQSFTLVPGQSTYTIGSGGNFNTTRPVRILGAYCTVQGVDFPIEIIDQLQYNLLSLKTQQEQIGLFLVYQNDMPLGRVILWPVPAANTTLTLSMSTSLAAVATTATSIEYPPGGAKALRYTLGVELAGEFGSPVLQTVMDTYRECVADFKRSMKRRVVSQFDLALASQERAIWQRGY